MKKRKRGGENKKSKGKKEAVKKEVTVEVGKKGA